MIKVRNPASIAAPMGNYSHYVISESSTIAHVSGQLGILPNGSLAGADSKSQTQTVFANLQRILDDLQVGPDRVVKLLTFVKGEDSIAGYRSARDEYFAEWYPHGKLPAHSLAVVSALASSELLVETEATVAL